jgi:hypothetical protein
MQTNYNLEDSYGFQENGGGYKETFSKVTGFIGDILKGVLNAVNPALLPGSVGALVSGVGNIAQSTFSGLSKLTSSEPPKQTGGKRKKHTKKHTKKYTRKHTKRNPKKITRKHSKTGMKRKRSTKKKD